MALGGLGPQSAINQILTRLHKKLVLSTPVCCSAECSAVDFATVLCTVVEMPSHSHCAAFGCSNKKNRCKRKLVPADDGKSYRRVRACGRPDPGCANTSEECRAVSFHRLPADPVKKARWLQAMKRKNVPLTEHTRICSVHFDEQARSLSVRQAPRGDPSIFFRVSKVKKARLSLTSRGMRTTPTSNSDPSSSQAENVIELEPTSVEAIPLTAPPVVQDEAKAELLSLRLENARLREENDQLKSSLSQLDAVRLSFKNLKDDTTLFVFYTGLDQAAFHDIMKLVGDSPKRMLYRGEEGDITKKPRGRSRHVPSEDELLLTIIKLRHNFPESDLACRFGISQSSVSRIFTTWVSCLYFTFKEVNIWPSQANVRRFMPSSFRVKYPSTRVIIDATEIFIDHPKNPDAQSTTWSTYKNHNTFKFLLGITPNGTPSFVSELYGGRISD